MIRMMVFLGLFFVSFMPMVQADPGPYYTEYKAFTDTNGHIILKSPPQFVLIAGDINIPLFVTPKNGVLKLVLVGDNWALQPITLAEFDSLTLTPAAHLDLQYYDMDKDGVLDLFIRDKNQHRDDVIIRDLLGTASLNSPLASLPADPDFDGKLFVPAPPVNGISINMFPRFELTNSDLRIYNGGQGSNNNQAARLIVIQAPNITLSANVEIIGPPVDLLFITNSNRTNVINCQQCGFSNVGRVTFAAGTGAKFASAIQATGSIGDLVIKSAGSITVNGLLAPGLQSLELIADRVHTSGTLDLNLRANVHPEGGYSIHPQGNKVVGSGGMGLYAGVMTIEYESLKVSAASVVNQALVIKGQLRAATIAVVSPKHITLASTATVSTISDLLATSTHNNHFYAPVEGIYIQGVGKHTSSAQHNVTLNG